MSLTINGRNLIGSGAPSTQICTGSAVRPKTVNGVSLDALSLTVTGTIDNLSCEHNTSDMREVDRFPVSTNPYPITGRRYTLNFRKVAGRLPN